MWPTIGAAVARYTRGSTHDGPGVNIKRWGGRSSPMISCPRSVITLSQERQLLHGPTEANLRQAFRERNESSTPSLVSLNQTVRVNIQNGLYGETVRFI